MGVHDENIDFASFERAQTTLKRCNPTRFNFELRSVLLNSSKITAVGIEFETSDLKRRVYTSLRGNKKKDDKINE